MKTLKKVLSIAMISIFILSSSIITSAEEKQANFKPEIDFSKTEYRNDGSIKYSVTNLEDFAKHLGLEENDILNINLIIFPEMQELAPQMIARSNILYIDNIMGPNESWGAQHFTVMSAFNNSSYIVDKEIQISGTASNTYSKQLNGGITVGNGVIEGAISSSIGIDVTHSQTLTDTTIIKDMKPYSSVSVYAYPIFDNYYFDIMQFNFFSSDERIGFGNAAQVKGMYTVVRN